MNDIFESQSEQAYSFRPRHVASNKLPLVGQELTSELRTILGIPEDVNPKRIHIKHTSQDYLVSNGYLIPYYARGAKVVASTENPDQALDVREFHAHPPINRDDRSRRNEELIIDRARSFVLNAEPEISTLRTRAQIEEAIAKYTQAPESTYEQCAYKAGLFKILVGAILTRFEMLGRVINQRNTQGVLIEYPELQTQNPISDEWVKALKEEYKGYGNLLMNSVPLLRLIAFTNHRTDYDGVLIDLIREICKPGFMNEDMVRDGIVIKIGNALKSIDQVHDVVVKAMFTGKSRELFEGSVKDFLEDNRYNVHTFDEVKDKLDELTALCRARACTRSDDSGYDEIYARKDVLMKFFLGPHGLLDSMKRVGRGSSADMENLRTLIRDGITVMNRTAYTRIPCNGNAPEPFVPNLSEDATPMEKYIADTLMSMEERSRARAIIKSISEMKENKTMNDRDAALFLNEEFCSLGRLRFDAKQLEQQLKNRETGRT